jgi:hypothetical protein
MKKTRANSRIDRPKTSDYFMLITLFFASAFIPLIVYMKPLKLEGILKDAWSGEESTADFFAYWKSQLLMVVLIVLVLYWLYRIIIKRFENISTLMLLPAGIYGVMVILSTLFAEYKEVALYGFVDRFEGGIVLITYILLLVTASVVVRTEKTIIPLLIVISVSCTVIAVLGLTQFYGVDFFQSSLGKKIILPAAYEKEGVTLDFKFTDHKIMYTTVYNPNYLGSYAALILPVAFGLYYSFIERKEKAWKIALGFLFCASSFVLMLGGMSRAGLLGGLFAVLIFIVLFRKKIIKFWPYTIILLLLLSGIYITLDLTSNGAVTREVKNTIPSFLKSSNRTSTEDNDTLKNSAEPSTFVEEINLNGNSLLFRTKTETLNIQMKDRTLYFTDEHGEGVTVLTEGNDYIFAEPEYALYRVTTFKGGFNLIWNDYKMPVLATEDGLFMVTKKNISINKIDKPETFGFKGLERFASSRGYIWSRSIPMLKKTIILGNGPDTYAIYFPQNEIDAKINYLDNPFSVVDKPHNWYLQMGINTGVISLIAMLVFLAWYWLKGFALWIKDITGIEKMIGAAILCGVTGYCIAALFNDSTVSVAPVFWTLLGVGIALLNKYKVKKIH